MSLNPSNHSNISTITTTSSSSVTTSTLNNATAASSNLLQTPNTSQSTSSSTSASSSSSCIVNTDSKWIFPLEKIETSPSRLDGMTKEDELSERQQAALYISDLGGRLKV